MGAFRGKNARLLTMIVAIAVIVVFAYITISNKNEQKANEEAQKENITKVDKVVLKNLDEEYPASVHEVVKYYCNVLQCMFNGQVTEKQIDQLIDKERMLFDKELLKVNEYSEFVEGRYSEIKQYKRKKITMVKFIVDDNDTVKYWQNNNAKMASIKAKIYMGGEHYSSFTQKYVLRKDKDDRWKILSWQNTDEKKDKKDK
ncbi:MAG: hypothetical protein E7262_11335 [Lachnospiraceae bacterium]|nr:hypothetical protein [Lachnospiraceae bacterium]